MLSRDSTPIPAIPRSQLTRSDSFPTPIQNTKTVSGLGALSGCQLVSVPYARSSQRPYTVAILAQGRHSGAMPANERPIWVHIYL